MKDESSCYSHRSTQRSNPHGSIRVSCVVVVVYTADPVLVSHSCSRHDGLGRSSQKLFMKKKLHLEGGN